MLSGTRTLGLPDRAAAEPPFLQSTSQLSGPTLIFDPGHRPDAPPRFWKEHRTIPHTHTRSQRFIFHHARLYGSRLVGSPVVCLGKFNICGLPEDMKLRVVAKCFDAIGRDKRHALINGL